MQIQDEILKLIDGIDDKTLCRLMYLLTFSIDRQNKTNVELKALIAAIELRVDKCDHNLNLELEKLKHCIAKNKDIINTITLKKDGILFWIKNGKSVMSISIMFLIILIVVIPSLDDLLLAILEKIK